MYHYLIESQAAVDACLKPDVPKSGNKLTFNLDHSSGADQKNHLCFKARQVPIMIKVD
jgi:hypothetical protein